MEQLRKDAAGLAVWNTVTPVAAVILAVFALNVFCKSGMRNGITWYVVFLLFTEIPLFVFYFSRWFSFLNSLKTGYEGNDTMRNAVRMGNIATALKLGCFALGATASLVIVMGNTGYNGTITASETGIMPTGVIQQIIESVMYAIVILFSIMFLFFRELTEKKSEMRILTVVQILLMVVWCRLTINSQSPVWGIFHILILLNEFLFLWKIYKGYEFVNQKEKGSEEKPE